MIAVDTNVLVYMSGFDDEAKQATLLTLMRRVDPSKLFVSMLVMAELHYVVTRRSRNKDLATAWTRQVQKSFRLGDLTRAALPGALDLVSRHGFQIFDALILESAALAGCGILLTEDGHHGFSWNGCTVVSPFARPEPSILTAALAADPH